MKEAKRCALRRRVLAPTMLGIALGAGLAGGALPAWAQVPTATPTLPDATTKRIPQPGKDSVALLAPHSAAAPTGLPGMGPAEPPPPASVPAVPPLVGATRVQAVSGHTKPGRATVPGALFGAPTAPPAPVRTPAAATTSSRRAAGEPRSAALALATGARLPASLASLSLAAIGPVAIGVPDFFIDNFGIPPFLLPIYQAAGIEYDVPWQVLAAINEVETDYGRNLSVSSAGATGWMQFLAATWRRYGVDANSDGVKDPYNPVDAIFGAARFLRAAGAAHDLAKAIFAYNHASWYVASVTLRAKLIGGLPADLVSSITGLTDGLFPVHSTTARYQAPAPPAALPRPGPAAAAAAAVKHPAISISARPGAAVVAVHDSTVTALGSSPALGRYITLRDSYGNSFTYGGLKKIAGLYAAPKPTAEAAAPAPRDLKAPDDPAPTGPASAGHQSAATQTPTNLPGQARPAPAAQVATDTAAGPPRLLAHPRRPAALAAGGLTQLGGAHPPLDLARYFAQPEGLRPGDFALEPLTRGAQVIAGTVLGRIGAAASTQAARVSFQIRPAGRGSPTIDPTPILDSWRLLDSTAIHRAADRSPLFGPAAQNPTVGQILLESKAQLERQVLADHSVDIYPCGRRDIQAGLVDRRILVTLEFLAASGLRPSISALRCGAALTSTVFDKTQSLSDNAWGVGVDISAVDGVPVLGHQGPGSITASTIRRLLTLQGIFKPTSILSLMSFRSTDNTFASPSDADRIHIGFAVTAAAASGGTGLGRQVAAPLRASQWLRLTARLGQIGNPTVATQPSSAAIAVKPGPAGPGGSAAPSRSAAASGPAASAGWNPLDGLVHGTAPVSSVLPLR